MKTADQWRDMTFVNRKHLGGYAKSDPVDWPHGDPMTYTPALWDWFLTEFRPRTVWDVGCGEGHAVAHFIQRGCDAWGVDGCTEVLETAAAPKGRIVIHDYTVGPLLPPPGMMRPDLVYSCEFVEHVEPRHMEHFLRTFDLARTVCFTHAFEGQPGHHHVNCQMPQFWISTMEARGFRWDEAASLRSREVAGRSHWERSGLVFGRP